MSDAVNSESRLDRILKYSPGEYCKRKSYEKFNDLEALCCFLIERSRRIKNL